MALVNVSEWVVESFNQTTTQQPKDNIWVAFGISLAIVYLAISLSRRKSHLPLINQDRSVFRSQAKKLIAEGFKKFSSPFRITTDIGPIIMLSPDLIDMVNQEPKLNFNKFTEQNFLSKYETFRIFRQPPPGLFEEAVMKGLTRSLPKFTKPLSDEMSSCLNDTWSNSRDWHETTLRQDVLNWVARLSSRIFNGELTTNEDWLRISKEYTVNIFEAVAVLKTYPTYLRWYYERTLPVCRKVRETHLEAAKLLAPMLEARKAEIAHAQAEGRVPRLPNDSIEWFRNSSKGRMYNEVDLQLGLGMAAIHTTSDLVAQAILNLCTNPEMVEPLREEIVRVMGEYGWQKVALTELRLLDSFLKETQRIKPISMASMHRIALADVSLPNGLKIKKGELTAISSHRMWTEDDYADPMTFDGFRFVKRRAIPGYENKSLLVSTSHDHTAFSHGKHACPGRFFAANEVKIAMVHILMKYDVGLEDKSQAKWFERGVGMMANPMAKINVRRRSEEMGLDDLVGDL